MSPKKCSLVSFAPKCWLCISMHVLCLSDQAMYNNLWVTPAHHMSSVMLTMDGLNITHQKVLLDSENSDPLYKTLVMCFLLLDIIQFSFFIFYSGSTYAPGNEWTMCKINDMKSLLIYLFPLFFHYFKLTDFGTAEV